MNPPGELKVLVNETDRTLKITSTMSKAVGEDVVLLPPNSSLCLFPQDGAERIVIELAE